VLGSETTRQLRVNEGTQAVIRKAEEALSTVASLF
jgi:hypothetical protein